jgi:hypothetical protein
MVDQVRLVDHRWNAALEASEFATPGPSFAARVRGIADASEQETAVLRLADSSGAGWNPVANTRRMRLSYELRRRQPSRHCEALESARRGRRKARDRHGGVAVSAVARGFADLAELAREVAAEPDAGDVATHRQAG